MDLDELQENISELHTSWFIGMEDDPMWSKNILMETTNLFSLKSSKNSENGRTLFTSRTLTLKDCDLHVGRLNKEVVKSLWSSLSLGKYFTDVYKQNFMLALNKI